MKGSYSVGVIIFIFSTCLLLFIYNPDGAFAVPVLKDSDFELEMIVNGLTRPTGISFLAPNDFLVIEEDTGKVKRVIDGQVVETVLDLSVSTSGSRGLLGIDSFVDNNQIFVFLYFTASSSGDGGSADGNRLYRYELIDNELVNRKLLLKLPSGPGPKDNGGPVVIGPDKNVYSVIGHIAGDGDRGHQTKGQNYKTGPNADGTSGIHRVTQDGSTVGSGILGSTRPLSTYYAYGIRNSFGMDFDPETGKLWSTENGPSFGDEINLVERGFNSGWKDVMGFAPSGFNYNGLEKFGGKGKYSDPEFVWKNVVSPTDLLFFNSANFGSEFRNDMFVGDYEFGRIYHFELDSDRDSLSLSGSLADREADSDSELQSVIFAEGLGVPTDLDVGPDGNLYVSSLRDGAIYKISKSDENSETINLDISDVRAVSYSENHVPLRAFDDSISTRWSNDGIGSWIQADLGSEKTVSHVDISWYRGAYRINNFVISVSDDGISFRDVYEATSSKSTSAQRYNIEDTNARYVRITVNGNSENNWASINEIDIYELNSNT